MFLTAFNLKGEISNFPVYKWSDGKLMLLKPLTFKETALKPTFFSKLKKFVLWMGKFSNISILGFSPQISLTRSIFETLFSYRPYRCNSPLILP